MLKPFRQFRPSEYMTAPDNFTILKREVKIFTLLIKECLSIIRENPVFIRPKNRSL